jgi:hypothetical protein
MKQPDLKVLVTLKNVQDKIVRDGRANGYPGTTEF